MREIVYDKNFEKNLKRRLSNNANLKKKFVEKVSLFLKDPTHHTLKNHKLIGSKKEYKAFSITGDIRVIYIEKPTYYIFLDIGTHNQVY